MHWGGHKVEPAPPAVSEPTDVPDRSWNLMNVLNMKQSRSGGVDAPRRLGELSADDRAIISAWLPGLPIN